MSAPRQEMPQIPGGMIPELAIFAGIIALLWGLATCSGCGASAVRMHAEAAAVTAVTVSGARAIIRESAASDFDRCVAARDLECTRTVEQRYERVSAAHDLVRTALIGWIEAIEIAHLASDGADLWGPLASALARVVQQWGVLVAALRPLGHELPALPPMLEQLLSAAGGGQ